MKKALLVLLGVLLGIAVTQGVQLLMSAVDAGIARRFGADTRAAMRQLEDYRRQHGTYPVACDSRELSTQLGPRNVVSQLGETWFQYCSDGQQYVLAMVPYAADRYRSANGAPLLATNDRLIAAPAVVVRADRAVGTSQ